MDPKIIGLVFLITLYFYINSAFAYWYPALAKFANNECTTLEGFTGTCLTKTQCQNSGGLPSGQCQNGIGICCLYQGSCGSVSSNNNTYFLNTNYPNPVTEPGICTFSIVPSSSNICLIRLDFFTLTLAQPDANGNCIFDSMRVTGAASQIPVICGENSGQHMYLRTVGINSIQVTIAVSSSVTLGRSFCLKATQIECDAPTQAPIGCLQYHTAASATVSSFNYGTDINGNLNDFRNGTIVAGSRQIANTNYGICVGILPGFCSIEWVQTSDASSFTVTEDTASVAVSTGLPGNPLIDGDCTTDYIVIANPSYPNGTAVPGTDRFCGNEFVTIITSAKPFVLRVVTDDNEVTDAANRGFALTYTQLSCANNFLKG